jgi:type III restriction enzyme
VEIKADTDISEDNKAKMNYAREHFGRLNAIQSKHKYCFNMLSKESYDQFFKFMREDNYDKGPKRRTKK